MSSVVQRDKTQLGMKTRPGRFAALLKEIRASKTCYLFLAPYAILFTLFVVPVIMAFCSASLFQHAAAAEWVGLHNTSGYFWRMRSSNCR